MAINNKSLSVVSALLTSQTTTEGDFRTGMIDVATQVDINDELFAATEQGDVTLFNEARSRGVVADDWTVLAGFQGSALDLNHAFALSTAAAPTIGQVLSLTTEATMTTPATYTWIQQNSPFQFQDNMGDQVQIDVGDFVQFIAGTGLANDFTDTSDGTETDPYDLTFSIADGGVGTTQLALGSVNADRLATDSVTETRILNAQVTNAKLANADGASVKGNATTSSAAPQDIVLQPNNVIARVGSVGLTSTQIVADLIAANAVDSSKIADNAVGNLQLNNAASFTAVDFTATSDRRLKDNIETITDALDKVNAMRGVSYTMLGKDSIGVIAQEMEEIVPEVVKTNDDGMMSVSYMHLVGVLIESIKELSAKVEKLEGK